MTSTILFPSLLSSIVAIAVTSPSGHVPTISADEFSQRRTAVVEKLRENAQENGKPAFLLLVASKPDSFAGDVNYPYRPDNNLYYLSGIPETRCALLLSSEAFEEGGHAQLFVHPGTARSRVWEGDRIDLDEAAKIAGLRRENVLDREELEHRLTALIGDLRGRATLYFETGRGFEPGSTPTDPYRLLLNTLGSQAFTVDLRRPARLIHPLREIKSEAELACLRRAVDITCGALISAIRHTEPGLHEYEIRSVIEGTYLRKGCDGWGFPSIVGSGPNSCVLHYHKYGRQMQDGDLLLMDVGAESSFYSADVTRTIPVNGRFSERQRQIYELVLDAQKQAIAAIRPGVQWRTVDRTARAVAAKGLVRLGLIENESQVRRYFLHGSSHGLGLAVHDPQARGPLRAGMVITVEPGIYLPDESLGVRIEDDVLVTEDGHEVLSSAVPKEIDEIEALMAERRF